MRERALSSSFATPIVVAMHVQHLRNATTLLTLGAHRILIDPMLSEVGALPGFKFFGGGRKPNPLVPLPTEARAALDRATAVLIIHDHLDHLDGAGAAWIRDRHLPVWARREDARSLRRRKLDVRVIEDGLDIDIQVAPQRHGRGLVGVLMGSVSGYLLRHPGEPSVYWTSDAILTDAVLANVAAWKPDLIVAPAGSASFGVGGSILFTVDELLTLIRASPAKVVLNHLEALDHCPTTRSALRERLRAEGLLERVWIPADGEARTFDCGPEIT